MTSPEIHSLIKNTDVSYHKVIDRIHMVSITNDIETSTLKDLLPCIEVEKEFTYKNFCNDFGPMNLGTVYQFCSRVDEQLKDTDYFPVVIISLAESKFLTNSVFLLGAYMIMRLGLTVEKLLTKLDPFLAKICPYRDVSPGEPNFDLRVQDCWAGLLKARLLEWVDFSPGPTCFDDEKYAHYDNPLNADLHELVPGKFVAMPSPATMDESLNVLDERDAEGHFVRRVFSPIYYADILISLGVEVVVRLDPLHYDRRAYFDFTRICTPP